MKEKLFIYARVSTERQVEKGGSLDSQKRLGIEKAKQLDLDYEIIEEKGRSANKEDLKNRPELESLVALIETKTVKYLFVTEWDRLTRNDVLNSYLKRKFKDNNVIVYTAKGEFDFNNIDDEFTSDIFATFAKRENMIRAEKSKRGKKDSAKKGKHHGGATAFGYDSDINKYLVINEKEAEIYQQIVQWHLEGNGVHSIAKKLNDLDVKPKMYYYTKKGYNAKTITTGEVRHISKDEMKWNGSSISRILKNSLYCGERRYKGEIYPAPKIISKEKWLIVQNKFQHNYEKSFRNRKYNFYLLSNLLVCSKCGKPMYGRYISDAKVAMYYCSSKAAPNYNPCSNKNVHLSKLNDLVWNLLLQTLTNSEIAIKQLKRIYSSYKEEKVLIEKKIKSLKKKCHELEEQRERAISLYTKNIILEKDIERQLNRIDVELSDVQRTIMENESNLNSFTDEDTNIKWLKYISKKSEELVIADDKRKREIILKFIKQVYVDYIPEKNDFSIIVELKYPLFDGKQTSAHHYLSDLYEYFWNNNDESIDEKQLRSSINMVKNELSIENTPL